jgi:hypothetical protein
MVKRLASIVLMAACVGAVFAFVPPSVIVEEAFATARGAFADNAAPNQPQVQRSCEDLEYWFLNGGCAKAHTKHSARIKHRVATSYVAAQAGAGDSASAKR